MSFKLLLRRIVKLRERGCTYCSFSPYVMVVHPRTEEVVDVFFVDKCDDASTLMLQLGVNYSHITRAKTIGERDHHLEQFNKTARKLEDHFDHGMYSRYKVG